MPWQALLTRCNRLPANPDLAQGYGTLSEQLGSITPFELAVRGAPIDGNAGTGISGGLSGGAARALPSAPPSLARCARLSSAACARRTCRPACTTCG